MPGPPRERHGVIVRGEAAWAIAARIVFAMLPSSAPCERVFSLVECMFGQDQLSSLADQLQGSVMLRYNKRAVG